MSHSANAIVGGALIGVIGRLLAGEDKITIRTVARGLGQWIGATCVAVILVQFYGPLHDAPAPVAAALGGCLGFLSARLIHLVGRIHITGSIGNFKISTHKTDKEKADDEPQ